MRPKGISQTAVLAVYFFCLSCAPGGQMLMEPPREGQSLLVGAVLLENIGIEDVYEAKTANIRVIIVGKTTVNGKEATRGYRVKTDANGYFFIPNVPPGAYVMKGIEADLGYETRLLLTSRWEGNTQIFYPTETIVDQTVRVWPPESRDRIIDMQICYFSIDAAYRTYHDLFARLDNRTLFLKSRTHTMKNPRVYFAEKFPQSGWFTNPTQTREN